MTYITQAVTERERERERDFVTDHLCKFQKVGTHLFSRITSDNGQDSRFDEIRGNAKKFSFMFFAQAMWVSLCTLPVTCVNALPLSTFARLPALSRSISAIGISIFLFGFAFEVMADQQKTRWLADKKAKRHSEDFLARGLWSRSRHPNYFGEITLWTGIAVASAGILASEAGQAALHWSASPWARLGACVVAGVSPAFTALLLTRVSGIPLTETKYDEKFGGRADYREWKRNTPVLVPKLW
jgi:steroid 5-alpha reductase family enzyme